GVPVRSVEGHLAKLINRGYKIAICDQVTPPGKGLVEREVTRIVTPGTVVEPGLLEGKANNYLASLVVVGDSAGGGFARGASRRSRSLNVWRLPNCCCRAIRSRPKSRSAR